MLRVLALGLTGTVLWSAEAAACVCVPQGPSIGRSYPEDGATDVPTDAVFRVAFVGPIEDLVRSLFRLVGPDGRVVPAHTAVEGRLVTVRPDAPLRRTSRYTVEQASLYQDNVRQDVVSAYIGAAFAEYRGRPPSLAGLERIWYPSSTFWTGDGPDRRVVASPVLRAATLVGGSHPCGAGEMLEVEVETADLDLSDWILLEVRGRPGAPAILTGPFAPAIGDTTVRARLGDRGCPSSDAVHLETDERGALSVRPVVVTDTGPAPPTAGWTTVTLAPPNWSHTTRETRAFPTSGAAAWLAQIPFATPRPPPLGPRACPFGFRFGERRLLADQEWPPSSRFPDDALGRAAGVFSDGPPAWGLILRGDTVRAYERGGVAAWELPVARGTVPLFAAATPSRVLVGWATADRERRWALLDRQTGVPSTGAIPAELAFGTRAIPRAAGEFVVLGAPGLPGTLHGLRLFPDGQMTPPVPIRGSILEDSAGGLYAQVDGGTLVRLGPDLAEDGPLIHLLRGESRSIVAAAGLVAIVSQGQSQTWVTAADPQTGTVAPVALVNGGQPVVAPLVVPTASGLSLLYGVRTGGLPELSGVVPVVEDLRCSSEIPPGPPALLAPVAP